MRLFSHQEKMLQHREQFRFILFAGARWARQKLTRFFIAAADQTSESRRKQVQLHLVSGFGFRYGDCEKNALKIGV